MGNSRDVGTRKQQGKRKQAKVEQIKKVNGKAQEKPKDIIEINSSKQCLEPRGGDECWSSMKGKKSTEESGIEQEKRKDMIEISSGEGMSVHSTRGKTRTK